MTSTGPQMEEDEPTSKAFQMSLQQAYRHRYSVQRRIIEKFRCKMAKPQKKRRKIHALHLGAIALRQSIYIQYVNGTVCFPAKLTGHPGKQSESRAPSSNRPHSWEDGDTAPPVRVRQTSQLNLVEIVCRLNFLAKYKCSKLSGLHLPLDTFEQCPPIQVSNVVCF
ncbi:uncharacterized protein LOC128546076 [Mercenaria mercenaria]|uniref:uncharacterized protein LOC128546076 n=1 Tax=Mercenaria mercenaria TaxID=6596 RepID=UPI00234EAA3B|nr:uncharacterized protein LOC128546076 [Mercenaria mercenaria]